MRSDMNSPARLPRLPCLLALLLLSALPVPRAFAADVFNGKQIYQTYCESCHGRNGQGEMPGTPNFTRGPSKDMPPVYPWFDEPEFVEGGAAEPDEGS